MTRETAIPVPLQERSAILDILRGFALLGILVDNSFGYTGWVYASPEMKQELSTFSTDRIVAFLETTLVHGKFYSIFSLLFGIGFSVILIRTEAKGLDPLKFFYRRLLILLLIGGVHLFFLWEGDILFLYALIGFLLPLFRKCSDKTLLIWAVALVLSPILIDTIKVITNIRFGNFLQELAIEADKRNGVPLDPSFAKYLFKEGSGFEEWMNWMKSGYLYRYSFLIETNRIPKVLGMFLLGYYVGRKMIYGNLDKYRILLKQLMIWGFAVGIPLSVAMTYFENDQKTVPDKWGLIDTALSAFSVVPLSLAFVAAICWWWTTTKGKSSIYWLAAPGKMALTNYLLQTIFGIIIFYGVGFGFGGSIGPTKYIPIVIILYLLQVVYSNIWLSFFNYGPVEWVWRQLTYGKVLALKKTTAL